MNENICKSYTFLLSSRKLSHWLLKVAYLQLGENLLGAQYLLRGVRNAKDFAAEQELAEANKRLAPEINTVLLLASPEWRMVSSSMVRELWRFGSDYRPFLSYELPERP